MAAERYERPEARVVEFGQGDMGRYVTTSDPTVKPGEGPDGDSESNTGGGITI